MKKHSGFTTKLILTVLIPFSLSYFIGGIYRSIYAVIALPIQRDLHVSASQLGLFAAMYAGGLALTQIPLGIFLDRFGPRKVQMLLFIVASITMAGVALSQNTWQLAIANGVMGFGLAGCLMASLKATSMWFSTDDLPFANSIVLAAGGIGAISATMPSEIFLRFASWRELIAVIAILTFLVAIIIAIFAPRDEKPVKHRFTFKQELGDLKIIYGDSHFWAVGFLAVMTFASFIAMQGLWAGPWLHKVAELNDNAAARVLLALSFGFAVGLFASGVLNNIARKFNVSSYGVVIFGACLAIITEICIILQISPGDKVLWFLFGFSTQILVIDYAILNNYFPREIAGRVITSLNVLLFLTAFIMQYGFGLILSWVSSSVGMQSEAIVYRSIFTILTALQFIGLLYFVYHLHDRVLLNKDKTVHNNF